MPHVAAMGRGGGKRVLTYGSFCGGQSDSGIAQGGDATYRVIISQSGEGNASVDSSIRKTKKEQGPWENTWICCLQHCFQPLLSTP